MVLRLSPRIGRVVRSVAGIAIVSLWGGCIGYPRGARSCSRISPPGSSTICAFGLPGVRASIADLDDGVRVTLSARGDATELRRRAHDVIEQRPGSLPRPADLRRALNKARLAFLDEPEGITVFVRAIDRADLREIRAAIHARVERARSPVCD